jgi:xylulokinase
MYLIRYDIGSSSVKASIIDTNTGICIASVFHPKEEMPIRAIHNGWAEQDPEIWWQNLKAATHEILNVTSIKPSDIKAIGISYQMHGLVIVDKNKRVLRPSIIWCDSRAVPIGEKAFKDIGGEKCLEHMLNSPGNFTASKLKWVKDNEPKIFNQVYKMMLPGDYIAMRLSGEICTTVSGLSEGILWDFKENTLADLLLEQYGIPKDMIPRIVDTFCDQGRLTPSIAKELGLDAGISIAYRAGDQPNNALSLNVFNPGEIAATAGTSGVVYGVSDVVKYDPRSRVNTFAHVNHNDKLVRLGVLLCINGTGISNSWIRKNILKPGISYSEMNDLALKIRVGSDGLTFIPFGNGAERMLSNREIGCMLSGINYNIHSAAHIIRAAHEGVAFSFKYGMEIMKGIGIETKIIRAGFSNMFLSPVFRETLSNITGATIELYNTDGSQGAALGAGLGVGLYKSTDEAFNGLKKILVVTPSKSHADQSMEAYNRWVSVLNHYLVKS